MGSSDHYCSTIKAGEIVVFDKAYVDFKHLYELLVRGVFWISRAKTNMKYEVVGQQTAKRGCGQLRKWHIYRDWPQLDKNKDGNRVFLKNQKSMLKR